MISTKDIGWVAGLLEGEGHFGYSKGSPLIQIGMTDRDVIAKFRNIIDKDTSITKATKAFGHKQAYTCRLHGSKAIQWMLTVYSFMGERRRSKIKEVVSDWTNNHRKVQGSSYCRDGHLLSDINRTRSGGCRICKRTYERRHYLKRKSA